MFYWNLIASRRIRSPTRNGGPQARKGDREVGKMNLYLKKSESVATVKKSESVAK